MSPLRRPCDSWTDALLGMLPAPCGACLPCLCAAWGAPKGGYRYGLMPAGPLHVCASACIDAPAVMYWDTSGTVISSGPCAQNAVAASAGVHPSCPRLHAVTIHARAPEPCEGRSQGGDCAQIERCKVVNALWCCLRPPGAWVGSNRNRWGRASGQCAFKLAVEFCRERLPMLCSDCSMATMARHSL